MKRLSVLFLAVLSLFVLFPAASAQAESAVDCGQYTETQAVSYIRIPAAAPDVYVKASRTQDQVGARLYFKPIDISGQGSCQLIGSVQLSSSVWQKVGSMNNGGAEGLLTLVLEGSRNDFGASSPQLLFTTSNLPCALGMGCTLEYQGSDFELSPKKISISADSLRVGLLSAIDKDKIKQVIYSVDGTQVYTKKALEAFDERYVAGGKHSVERTVVLGSGQALSDKRVLEKGSVTDVNYLLLSNFIRFKNVLLFLGGLSALLLLWLTVVWTARKIYQRRSWRATHVLIKKQVTEDIDTSLTGPQANLKYGDSSSDILRRYKKQLSAISGFFIVSFIVFSFGVNVFTVDGVSMDPTLIDGSKKPLFVLPAIIGKINGNGYTPARGAIVVIQKDDNNLFDNTVAQKSYVVKRVIALPGERVTVKETVITVFNKDNPNGFIPDDQYKWVKNVDEFEYFNSDLTLKQGELFVVGDNRQESVDSRTYGPIKTTQVLGRVL